MFEVGIYGGGIWLVEFGELIDCVVNGGYELDCIV